MMGNSHVETKFLMKMLKEMSFVTTNLRRSNGCKVGSSQVGAVSKCLFKKMDDGMDEDPQ